MVGCSNSAALADALAAMVAMAHVLLCCRNCHVIRVTKKASRPIWAMLAFWKHSSGMKLGDGTGS